MATKTNTKELYITFLKSQIKSCEDRLQPQVCFTPKSLLFTITGIWYMTFQEGLEALENG